jgi:hypothetical protein
VQTDATLTHCRQCGHQVPTDPRYVTWCDRCDWNVDSTRILLAAVIFTLTAAFRPRITHRAAADGVPD